MLLAEGTTVLSTTWISYWSDHGGKVNPPDVLGSHKDDVLGPHKLDSNGITIYSSNANGLHDLNSNAYFHRANDNLHNSNLPVGDNSWPETNVGNVNLDLLGGSSHLRNNSFHTYFYSLLAKLSDFVVGDAHDMHNPADNDYNSRPDYTADLNVGNNANDVSDINRVSDINSNTLHGVLPDAVGSGLGISIYFSCAMMSVLFFFGFIVLRIFLGQNAARKLHMDCQSSVMRAKMSFLDTTPAGRIINRFAEDTVIIDNNLPQTMSLNCQWMFRLSMIFILASLVSWYILLMFIPICWVK
jgi:ABC-type multidrug transport system fused ATPase/permease subunit